MLGPGDGPGDEHGWMKSKEYNGTLVWGYGILQQYYITGKGFWLYTANGNPAENLYDPNNTDRHVHDEIPTKSEAHEMFYSKEEFDYLIDQIKVAMSNGDHTGDFDMMDYTGGTGNVDPAFDSIYYDPKIGDDGDHRIIVFNDTRVNPNDPAYPNIVGDMSRHGLIYDGQTWHDYGVIIGYDSGFVPDEWKQPGHENIDVNPRFNVDVNLEGTNKIHFDFTNDEGRHINMYNQILNNPEKFEIIVCYMYTQNDKLVYSND
jgi:hypothetical protein